MSQSQSYETQQDQYNNLKSQYNDHSNIDQKPIYNYHSVQAPIDDNPVNQSQQNDSTQKGQRGIVDYIDIAVNALTQQLHSRSNQASVYICDYGCATGTNSIPFIHALLQYIYSSQHVYTAICPTNNDITVVHSDQLGNSFDTLFDNIDASGYYNIDSITVPENSNVFTLASSMSFFSQVVARNSTYIGFTQATLHWLSSLPCNLTDTFHSVFAQAHEKHSFAQQAAADWRTLLQHRSAELVPGGVLLISLYCSKQNETDNPFNNTHRAIDTVLQSMLQERIISRNELVAATCPMYYRDETEYLNSNVLQQTNFNVVYHTQVQIHNPMYAAYEATGDAGLFAQQHTSWCRSWTYNTLVNAFTGPDKDQKIDLVYQRLQQYVQHNVQHFNGQPNVAYIILQKQGQLTDPEPQRESAPVIQQQMIAAYPSAATIVAAQAGHQTIASLTNDVKPNASTLAAAAAGAATIGSLHREFQNEMGQRAQSVNVRSNGTEYQLNEIMYTVLESLLRAGDELETCYHDKDKSIQRVIQTNSICESIIVDNLLHHFPNSRIVTETTYDSKEYNHNSDGLTFFVSSIEGRNNYIHNSPFCCLSVGVQANKKIIAGMVHAPVLGTTYHAVEKQGAFVSNFRKSDAEPQNNNSNSSNTNDSGNQSNSNNDSAGLIAGYKQVSTTKLHVSDINELSDALVRTELHYNAPQSEIDNTLAKIRNLMQKNVSSIRCIGCIPLNLCSVAMGSTDVYFECKNDRNVHGLAAWSVAAGSIIVREAGGIVCNTNKVDKYDLFSGHIVAANNKKLAESVVKVTKGDDSNNSNVPQHEPTQPDTQQFYVPPSNRATSSTLDAANAGVSALNQYQSPQTSSTRPTSSTLNAAGAGVAALSQYDAPKSQYNSLRQAPALPSTRPTSTTLNTTNAAVAALQQYQPTKTQDNTPVQPSRSTLDRAAVGSNVISSLQQPSRPASPMPQPSHSTLNAAVAGAAAINQYSQQQQPPPSTHPYSNAPSHATQQRAYAGTSLLNAMDPSGQTDRRPPLPVSLPPTHQPYMPPSFSNMSSQGYKLGQANKSVNDARAY